MVYVDDMYAPFRDMKMCHMIADSSSELFDIAKKMGLKAKWVQHAGTAQEHFDITKRMRRRAIIHGAKEISMLKLAQICYNRR